MTAQHELKTSSKSFTRRQITVLVLLCYGNFWSNACYSLIAPFFPKEAETKGATPTQYGLIFSVYQLMYLLTAPLVTRYFTCLSPKFTCFIALFIESLCYILFGLLIWVPNGWPFICLSFLLRIIGGITSSFFTIASFCIAVQEFPQRPVQAISFLVTNFGLGLVSGPTLGGLLFQFGGYLTPFIGLGGVLMIGSLLVIVLYPEAMDKTLPQSSSFWHFMADTGRLLEALTIALTFNIIGFNDVTLEPHLRQFNLNPFPIGCIFITYGIVYGISFTILGKICDKMTNPLNIAVFGYISCIIGFLLIGPQFFLPFDTYLWLIIVSLVLTSFGNTAKMTCAFANTLKHSINNRGFPDDISTYAMASAHYLMSYSFGSIVGSSLGGFMLEKYGYRKATFPLLIVEMVMTISLLVYIFREKLTIGRRKTIKFEIDLSKNQFEFISFPRNSTSLPR